MITITPNNKHCFDLLLTTSTQLSHHDPATGDGSNTLSFNRQKQLVERDVPQFSISQDYLNYICDAFHVPAPLLPLIQQTTFEQFVGIAITKLLLDIYNNVEGTGLMSGMDRYDLLESRTKSAATRRFTIMSFWSTISSDLLLPIHTGKHDEHLVTLFSLPIGLQRLVLSTMMSEHRAIITIARSWHTMEKLSNATYAGKVGKGQIAMVSPHFDAATAVKQSQSILPMEMPAISANSLRHCIVRDPSWIRLVSMLGIDNVTTDVPQGVEALFVNGGNKRAGAKEPSGASQLAIQIRKLYPSLDLLSGVADTFDLGEGLLSVASHLVCHENRSKLYGDALQLPQASLSAYDMMDTSTMTRHATQHGLHQMIFNQEVMASGVAVVVRLSIHPFASALTTSALVSAVEQFQATPFIGGQSARGYGWTSCQWGTNHHPTSDMYHEYLENNKFDLLSGILTGKLGTNTPLCQ